MKYLENSFSSGANSERYRSNYDKIFKKKAPRKAKPKKVESELFKCGYVPKPDHEMGHRWSQLEREMEPEAFKVFGHWMRGQTVAVCQETQQGVVYPWDLDRWVRQRERWRTRGVDRLPEDQDLVDWD